MCVGGYVHISAGALRDQERALDPLKLELHVGCGSPDVGASELWSSARINSTDSMLTHLSSPI